MLWYKIASVNDISAVHVYVNRQHPKWRSCVGDSLVGALQTIRLLLVVQFAVLHVPLTDTRTAQPGRGCLRAQFEKSTSLPSIHTAGWSVNLTRQCTSTKKQFVKYALQVQRFQIQDISSTSPIPLFIVLSPSQTREVASGFSVTCRVTKSFSSILLMVKIWEEGSRNRTRVYS